MESIYVLNSILQAKPTNKIDIKPPPPNLQGQFNVLFTPEALTFLSQLVTKFDEQINQLYRNRFEQRAKIKENWCVPKFSTTPQTQDKTWRIPELPERLKCRYIDLGDVSPANSERFFQALRSNAQGIQVDFDDGHSPTWKNQILGLFNIYSIIHGLNSEFQDLNKLPLLIFRPRAWNMIEHNIIINGKKLPGPLVDFAIIMFHNAKILTTTKNGPFLYLSKLESASEAKLWNDIFVWTQNRLKIPQGTIKACVLIENILAAFEMDDILFELKEHTFGLNCGIWDYAASIISIFGDNKHFIIPDRSLYVDMDKHFLKKYMELVIQTCHARGVPASGGMAAQISNEENKEEIIQIILDKKTKEINANIDGFLLYDIKLVPDILKLWNNSPAPLQNQPYIKILEDDLLKIPTGCVTFKGLKHNLEVSILFIYNWLKGSGTFVYKNMVEDSATAEISRSQIWQWIRHKVYINDNGKRVTKTLVAELSSNFIKECTFYDKHLLNMCNELFLNIVTAPYFIDFITTFLNDHNYEKPLTNKVIIQKSNL